MAPNSRKFKIVDSVSVCGFTIGVQTGAQRVLLQAVPQRKSGRTDGREPWSVYEDPSRHLKVSFANENGQMVVKMIEGDTLEVDGELLHGTVESPSLSERLGTPTATAGRAWSQWLVFYPSGDHVIVKAIRGTTYRYDATQPYTYHLFRGILRK